MNSREILVSYLHVAVSLNVIKELEKNDYNRIYKFKTNKNELEVYLDLETYMNNQHIYLHITKYLDNNKVERIEITKTYWELKGNAKEHFDIIFNEIDKFNKLLKNNNY